MSVYAVCVGCDGWPDRVWEAVSRLPGDWNLVKPDGIARKTYEPPRFRFFLNWSSRVTAADAMYATECVNFHCTPLPYGRGGHPIENMILRGHTETVITAHRMTVDLDAGPIYGTRGPISLAGTKAEIQQRFVEPVLDLMRWIVETQPEPTPQAGDIVRFQRLSSAAYREFWRIRG